MEPITALRRPGFRDHWRAGTRRGRGEAEVEAEWTPVAIVGFGGTERDVKAVIVDSEGELAQVSLSDLRVDDERVLAIARGSDDG